MAPSAHSDLIDSFIAMLRAQHLECQYALVLVGSVARGTDTESSDVDLLVIANRGLELRRTASRLHVQLLSESEFLKRLEAGDDFAAWSVRFGIPVVNSEVWNRIVESPCAEFWPDWRIKIKHSLRRLYLANELLAVDDEEAAAEELAYAVSHIGRALLLKKGVFPLSRPELSEQLLESGYSQLAKVLKQLGVGCIDLRAMRQTARYVKKLLVFLDRAAFKQYASKRKMSQALKTN